MNMLSNITDWSFLSEPLYRWAIFIGAMFAILWGWNGVLAFMR